MRRWVANRGVDCCHNVYTRVATVLGAAALPPGPGQRLLQPSTSLTLHTASFFVASGIWLPLYTDRSAPPCSVCHSRKRLLYTSWNCVSSSLSIFSSFAVMSAAEATASKPSNSASDGKAESKGEPTTHPLEHKWTLWFDNPKGTQRPVSHQAVCWLNARIPAHPQTCVAS